MYVCFLFVCLCVCLFVCIFVLIICLFVVCVCVYVLQHAKMYLSKYKHLKELMEDIE